MYKRIDGADCISDHIENEEKFPIGFGDVHMITDYESFSNLFEKIRKNADRLMNTPTVKAWYSKLGANFDFSLFCHMLSFNTVMQKEYPDTINAREHQKFYSEKPKKLSEAVAEKKCACTEYAVLAQAYFQKQEIPTRYVEGELVIDDNFDDYECHSFIAFFNNGHSYIFDPVNPYVYNRGMDSEYILPHIAKCVGKKDLCYLQTESLFQKGENWRYCCGEHGDFLKNLPVRGAQLTKKLKKSSLINEQLMHNSLNTASRVTIKGRKNPEL